MPLWVCNKFSHRIAHRMPGSLEAVCGCEMSETENCHRPAVPLHCVVMCGYLFMTSGFRRLGTHDFSTSFVLMPSSDGESQIES